MSRLAFRFTGDRTSIDDDDIVEPGFRRMLADHLRLISVKAAAKGQDLRARHVRNPSPMAPVKLIAVGPIIMT